MKAHLFYENHSDSLVDFPIRIAECIVNESYIDFSRIPEDQIPEFKYLYEDNNPTVIFHKKSADINELDLIPPTFPEAWSADIPNTVFFQMHKFMEITTVTDGSVLYIVNKKPIVLTKGDIIIFNSFIPHAWIPNKQEKPVAKDYSFVSDTVLFNDLIQTDKNFLFKFIKSDITYLYFEKEQPLTTRLLHILEDIDAEYKEKQFAHEIIIKSKLMEFFSYIARTKSNYDKISTEKIHPILTKALKIINADLSQDITLQRMADECFMSPQYFSSFFKKNMGVTFSYYLNKVRIEKSIDLLQNTEMSILEISMECGFTSVSNFYRAFHSIYGISPSHIRKLIHTKNNQKLKEQ